MENTSGLYALVHYSMATEVMEGFPLFFIFTSKVDIIGRTFFPSCFRIARFLIAGSEVNGSDVTA